MIAPAAATETRMAPNDKRQLTPEVAGDLLEAIYAASCAALSRALDRYLATGTPPTLEERAAFRYPLLSVACHEIGGAARTRRAFAKFQQPGIYETTVTHPRHFRSYLLEQLMPLVARTNPSPAAADAVDNDRHHRRPLHHSAGACHRPIEGLCARVASAFGRQELGAIRDRP